jgi:membrane protein YdbS with pleckstrin-like domain
MKSNKAVVEEFAARRRLTGRLTLITAVIIGLVLFYAYNNEITKTTATFILIVLFIWAFTVNFKLWRCPSCNGHLGKLYFGLSYPKYCPNCGVKLIDNDFEK